MCYELGDKLGIASALAGLGSVEVSTSIAGEVSASATETTGSSGAEETVARRTNATNRLRRAVRLLGAVEALLTSMGAVLAAEDRRPYERGIAQARAGLREADFEQAMQEGRAMSMEEAFEYALEEN